MYELIKLNPNSKLIETLNFFIYDSIKIILLLFFMILILGFIRTYISERKIKEKLKGKNTIFSNFIAASFGAITPFCSCSSIPLFFSFINAGVPLGTTFSFLITSPLVNQYVVVLMLGFFGWKITLIYILAGILIGVIAGLILGKMNIEKYLEKDMLSDNNIKSKIYKNIKERIKFGLDEAKSVFKKIWIWILVGVGLGAIIHNYVPEEAIKLLLNKTGIFTVPLATLLGVPIYGSCVAIVPIAVELFQKGIPLGTALAFMMAISALSLPEAIMLRRIMKLKLIIIFFGIVTLSIIIVGYLLNLVQLFIV